MYDTIALEVLKAQYNAGYKELYMKIVLLACI